MFGIVGLALITFAARLLHLQPGAISLLYLIVVVFVSLRAGFVSSCRCFPGGSCLFALLLSSAVLSGRNEEPAGYRGDCCFPDHGLGDYRNGGPSAQVDGSPAHLTI